MNIDSTVNANPAISCLKLGSVLCDGATRAIMDNGWSMNVYRKFHADIPITFQYFCGT